MNNKREKYIQSRGIYTKHNRKAHKGTQETAGCKVLGGSAKD